MVAIRAASNRIINSIPSKAETRETPKYKDTTPPKVDRKLVNEYSGDSVISSKFIDPK
jgi:hypothetical protein